MRNDKKYYQRLADEHALKRHYMKNALQAFVAGGLISLLGQALLEFYKFLEKGEKEAISLMLSSLIFLAILLSGLGLYDKIGQVAKAGTIIPITGFANAMASAAIEYRPEGIILGIGANTFKLAGTVIVYGVFSGLIVALIKYGVYLI